MRVAAWSPRWRATPLLGDRQEVVRDARGERSASMAICTLPSVPFLKPTGIDRPEASSRWTWLSVVRAPMAPQRHEIGDELRRDRCRGTRCPRARRSAARSQQEPAREAQALVDREAAVEIGIVDQALPADRGARLLEVDAHHHEQSSASASAPRREPPRRTRAPPSGSWIEHGPTTTSRRRSSAAEDGADAARGAAAIGRRPRSVTGISSIKMAGGSSGRRPRDAKVVGGVQGRGA